MPETLITLLRHTADAMVRELVERLHTAGYRDIRVAHTQVFENIDRPGTRLTTLAARAGVTHQSMGALVGELERLGYLDRGPDPDDGRARLVIYTQRGLHVQRRSVREIAEIEAAWTAAWGLPAGALHRALAGGLRGSSPGTKG